MSKSERRAETRSRPDVIAAKKIKALTNSDIVNDRLLVQQAINNSPRISRPGIFLAAFRSPCRINISHFPTLRELLIKKA
ncbi:hypothetical protein DTO271D3_641 [Paecilomyces variotii]|nr:hypothetical protein DTO169E5_5958 [Paecilomyces variotii]KAJ9319053.1 hypothetical protein DTO271D3_641 [Paecilomyces variotii]